MTRQNAKLLGLAGLAAATLLSGCGSTTNYTYREYGKLVSRAFSASFSKVTVTREDAAAIPYASMGYRIDGGDQGILVLATNTGGTQLWTAASHVVFQTRDGRITKTVGLPFDLGGVTPHEGEALASPAAALKNPFTSIRFADLSKPALYAVPITCNTAAGRPERILILGQPIATMRVDESCESRSLNWRFVDSFWLDPQTGFAWRSQQHLSPAGETVETEIFRPPG